MQTQERATPTDLLASFINDGLITEVLHTVKSGKEATVYCCRANQHNQRNEAYAVARAPLLAAKVYRPLGQRGFRNDAVYRAGNFIRNGQSRRAAKKKSEFGREVLFRSWIEEEFQVLRRLHAAGADVPQPIARSGNALIMEYVGDEGAPAPMLTGVSLELAEAQAVFERLLRNVQTFLSRDRVHGDLSPFNVLYWRGAVKIIDFPQAVDARTNPNAYFLLRRDLENVCHHFERFGVAADPDRLAGQLWAWFLHGAQAGPA